MQKRKAGEELVVAKSKPTLSLVSRSVNRSPMLDAGVSCSPESYGTQSRNSDPSSIEKSMAREQDRLTETRLTHHNFEISNTPYLEKLLTNVRHKLSRQEVDQMLDLKVNGISWRIFMLATLKAAVHLGLHYKKDLFFTKNTDFEQLKTMQKIVP